MPNKIQQKRLNKWIDFVAKVPKKKFDFNEWGKDRETGDFTNPTINICTTVGCAAGWLPYIFPRSWTHDLGIPGLKNNKRRLVDLEVGQFFGISLRISTSLVIPSVSSYDIDGTLVGGIPKDVSAYNWSRHAKRILKAHGVKY